MSANQAEYPSTNDPYHRLFEGEYARLKRVRELVDDEFTDTATLREEIAAMVGSYQSLIRQAIRLTRAGDRIGDQLNRSRKELERRNRILIDQAAVRDELISVTAHDLQNPLGAIVGMTELLREEVGTSPDSPASDYLNDIDESARHLLHLVNDLLAMSRLERGTLQLRSEMCILDEIVQVLRPKYVALAAKKSISLNILEGQPAFPVRGDPSALRRVMENLISNAVKFCSADCTIEIVTDYTHDEFARVAVRDDGPGIRLDDQQKLFKPYGLTSNRPTGGELSNGLGLSISKQLIEAMDGTIECNSTPGEGSIFQFDIPRFMGFENQED